MRHRASGIGIPRAPAPSYERKPIWSGEPNPDGLAGGPGNLRGAAAVAGRCYGLEVCVVKLVRRSAIARVRQSDHLLRRVSAISFAEYHRAAAVTEQSSYDGAASASQRLSVRLAVVERAPAVDQRSVHGGRAHASQGTGVRLTVPERTPHSGRAFVFKEVRPRLALACVPLRLSLVHLAIPVRSPHSGRAVGVQWVRTRLAPGSERLTPRWHSCDGAMRLDGAG